MGIGMDVYRTDDKGRVDLGKSWHEVHYALTGTFDEGPDPLAFLMTPGEEVHGGFDDGMGYWEFRAAACRRIASALSALKDDTIRARFAPDARPRGIYHGGNDVEYVLEVVGALRALFDRAAKDKATVAISFV